MRPTSTKLGTAVVKQPVRGSWHTEKSVTTERKGSVRACGQSMSEEDWGILCAVLCVYTVDMNVAVLGA